MNSEAMRSTLRITKTLSDIQRLRILMALRTGQLCVCQIIEVLGALLFGIVGGGAVSVSSLACNPGVFSIIGAAAVTSKGLETAVRGLAGVLLVAAGFYFLWTF